MKPETHQDRLAKIDKIIEQLHVKYAMPDHVCKWCEARPQVRAIFSSQKRKEHQ